MADELDSFLVQHGIVQTIVDSAGLKGACATAERIKGQTGASDRDLDGHIELFKIDKYAAEAISRTYCTRDAIRLMSKRLATAME